MMMMVFKGSSEVSPEENLDSGVKGLAGISGIGVLPFPLLPGVTDMGRGSCWALSDYVVC